LSGKSQYFDGVLNCYLDRCAHLVRGLDTFSIRHVHREANMEANYLAQQASDYRVKRGKFAVNRKPAVQLEIVVHVNNYDQSGSEPGVDTSTSDDWRRVIRECIKNSGNTKDIKVRWQVLKYTIWEDELYRSR
jgi:hypothetical protein